MTMNVICRNGNANCRMPWLSVELTRAQMASRHVQKHSCPVPNCPNFVVLCRENGAFADLCWPFRHM